MTPFVASAAAGGKGPPGSVPDGSKNIRETDRRCESAFYRNATYTRGTTNNTAPPPFVLQEVPLTPFDGSIREYPRFRDRFLDITETLPHLEPRHKLVHLLQYLRGEPLRMADRLRITDDNYFAVVDLLEERYGNKSTLETLLIQDLIDLPALPTTKLSDVIKFHDDAFQIIADLGSLAQETMAAQLLLGKFPNALKEFLAKEIDFKGPTTNDTLSALHRTICRTRQMNTYLHSPWDSKPIEDPDVITDEDILARRDEDLKRKALEDEQEGSLHGPDQGPSEPADHQDAVAMNASTEQRLKERRTCPLCGLLHTAFRCTVFTHVNARLRRIQKLKLCLLCLRKGHKAAACPQKATDSCQICKKGPHNRAICVTANSRAQGSNRRRSPVRATGPSVGPKHPDQDRRTQKQSVNSADAKRMSTANLRQSEAQSSSKSTPKTNRKKRSKKPGATSSGRNGTTRPSTKSTAKIMKHKTAVACGDSRLLPARQGLPLTDRCSKTDESTQFDQRSHANGTGLSDAAEKHELRDEEDASSESSGSYTDSQALSTEDPPDSNPLQPQVTEPWPSGHPHDEELQPGRWQPYYPSDDDVSLPSSQGHNSDPDLDWEERCYAEESIFVACASNDEPTTLLECINLTAENPCNGISRNVIVFFDSGSNRSFLSTALAHDLRLPLSEQGSVRVSTFGSELPTTVKGFSTSIVLHSKHRRLPPLAFTACDSIVSSVRTALVETSDLPKLRRGDLTPSTIQVTPDILIGQDLVSHFKRRYRPTLPHGFYVVSTVLGPLLGGSGNVPTTIPVAATNSSAALRRKHTRTHSARKCKETAPNPSLTHSVKTVPVSTATDQDFSLRVEKIEFSWSTTSASRSSDRHILLDRTAGPRLPRKPQNRLDTTALLPPLSTTTHVMLQPELRENPCLPTSLGSVPDRRSRSSVQQSPAPIQTRKTQLRRHSSTIGRQVLGIKNHGELRKCDTMRTVHDLLHSATETSTRVERNDNGSPHKTDFMPHAANGKPARCPEFATVLVASVPASTDLLSSDEVRPATRTPAHSAGTRYKPPLLIPAHAAGNSKAGPTEPQTIEAPEDDCHRQNPSSPPRHCLPTDNSAAKATTSVHSTDMEAKAVSSPPPTHSVGLEQAVDTQSNSAADELHRERLPRTSTGSGQRKSVNRRVSVHSQDDRFRRSARRATSVIASTRSRVPIIDGFVSKCFAAFLASGETNDSPAVDEDLPSQYQFIGYINHLGVPSSYLPPTKFKPSESRTAVPLGQLTFDKLAQEDIILPWKFVLGSTLGALPPYWEMVTSETFLHLHEEAQGATYNGMHVCGIGPTGFFLSAESDRSTRVLEGQRQALLRFGRLARNTGKCLVLIVYDEPETGIDLHHEAVSLLRHDAQLQADHPIHLVAYRASADQLQHWLQMFPNVVFGVDHSQLTSLLQALQAPDHHSELYLHALDLQTFFTEVPLDNLALHSGCPSPLPSGHPGYFQTPTILLRAVELFEQLTGTRKDVLLEHSAKSLNAIYHLNLDLPHSGSSTCDGGDESRGPHVTDDLSERPHPPLGRARRADHTDQGRLTSRHSTTDATHSVAQVAVTRPHAATDGTRPMCVFCDNVHSSTECPTFSTGNKRLGRAEKRKLCTLCLGKRHKAAACPERTSSSCQHCDRGQHHPALCRNLLPTPSRLPTAHATHSVARSTMCAFCDGGHPSAKCKTFSEVKYRMRRLQTLKRCCLCLEEVHPSSTCPKRTPSSCDHCRQGQHHPALCKNLQQENLATFAPRTPSRRGSAPPTATRPPTVTPAAAHSVAREAGPTRRTTAAGTFPSVMNHFRRDDHPSAATETDTRVSFRSANKRSAAVSSPAQAPSKQPSRPRPSRTTTDSSGSANPVHAPGKAGRRRKDPSKPAKTPVAQKAAKTSTAQQTPLKTNNSKQAHSVGKESRNHAYSKQTHSVSKESRNQAPHGEKKERSSRDDKTRHRSTEKPTDLAEALSTLVVAPAEAHRQPAKADHRRNHARKPEK